MESQIKRPRGNGIWLLGVVASFIWLMGCTESASTDQSATSANGTTEQAAPETATSDKGVGPVSSVDVGASIDQALVDKGKAIFESKCAACHKFDERYVGPALSGVTQRRKPEWIMNMVLNPQGMLDKDPTAQELLSQFMTPMPNQNLTEEDARAILEYFRSIDTK